MKFSRVLEMRVAEPGWVAFHARRGDALSESELESELLAVIYAADPALDSVTGRLVTRALADHIAARMLLLGPDQEGFHHLGGIACLRSLAPQVAALASKRGYTVVGEA